MNTSRNDAVLKTTLRADLTAAIKGREKLRADTLRMVLTAIQMGEVAGAESVELDDSQVVSILRTEIKKRVEAAAGFEKGGRAESAAKERSEAEIISAYLPKQLDDAAVDALVADAISEAGVTGMAGMGAVMKIAKPKAGDLVAGDRLAAAVRKALQG